mmetsp:Transcript_16864/g.23464  ORF Transcript_16864/g.23464 Transcript_16864/m.23464 type:complete len:776 (+) Transcript_16864:183-2510(+)
MTENTAPDLQSQFTPRNYDQNDVKATIQIQSIARKRLAVKNLLKNRRQVRRRVMIVEEILSTEKSYVNSLKAVIECFMHPMKNNETLKNLVSDEQFRTLFSDIEVVHRYNTVFLEKLQEKVSNLDPFSGKLSDAFLMIADYLKAYTGYVNNYNAAHWCLKELQENKDFATWCYEQRKLPQLENKDLDDFLIMPVQRIPRYNLLLNDLVKATWVEHPDYQQLCRARDKIGTIAEFVNEQKRKVENLNKVGEIISSIVNLDAKVKLLSPTRRFVREGKLYSVENTEKKRYYTFLFNDLLMFTKQKKKKEKLFEYQRLVYLTNSDVRLAAPIDGKMCFAIKFMETNEVIVCYAKTEEQTSEWVDQIISCRAEILEKEEATKVAKRKTFVHEELMKRVDKKRAVKPKGGTILSKLIKKDVPKESPPTTEDQPSTPSDSTLLGFFKKRTSDRKDDETTGTTSSRPGTLRGTLREEDADKDKDKKSSKHGSDEPEAKKLDQTKAASFFLSEEARNAVANRARTMTGTAMPNKDLPGVVPVAVKQSTLRGSASSSSIATPEKKNIPPIPAKPLPSLPPNKQSEPTPPPTTPPKPVPSSHPAPSPTSVAPNTDKRKVIFQEPQHTPQIPVSSQALQQSIALKRAASAVTLPSQQAPKEKVPDKGHQSMPIHIPAPQPTPVVGPSQPDTQREVLTPKKTPAPAPPPQSQKPTRTLAESQPAPQATQPAVGPTITHAAPTSTSALPNRPLPAKTASNPPAPVKRVLPAPVPANTLRKDGKSNSQY